MSYAIVINLDYENNSEELCQEIWEAIKARMLTAGFRLDNRVFMTKLPQKEACDLARSVLEGLEAHLEFHRKHVFRFLKDFYGYDMEHTRNLLVPDTDEIVVRE